ncbi:MAG: PilZ domain-containing protein [Acidithiobacillus caldus]|nr:PilZ domain-containing protein [Acidithiobacillus caldus]
MPRIRGGGVLVETPNLLPMGTEVLLMISLPDNQPRAPVTGRVVWVTPQGQSRRLSGSHWYPLHERSLGRAHPHPEHPLWPPGARRPRTDLLRAGTPP